MLCAADLSMNKSGEIVRSPPAGCRSARPRRLSLLAGPHRALRVGGRRPRVRPPRKHRVRVGQRVLSEPLVLQGGRRREALRGVQAQHAQQQVKERVGLGEGPAGQRARARAGRRPGQHERQAGRAGRGSRAAGQLRPCCRQDTSPRRPSPCAPQQRAALPQHLLEVDGSVLRLGLAAAPRVVAPVPQALHVGPGALGAGVAQRRKDPGRREQREEREWGWFTSVHFAFSMCRSLVDAAGRCARARGLCLQPPSWRNRLGNTAQASPSHNPGPVRAHLFSWSSWNASGAPLRSSPCARRPARQKARSQRQCLQAPLVGQV